MNRILLALLATTALTASASAGDWYASTFGGFNQDDVISGVKGVDGQSGYVIGGTIGKRLGASWRIEAEASFRQNEVDIFGGAISADHDTQALTANVAYDFGSPDSQFRPFLLAGVGVATTRATFENIALARLESSGIISQVGAGFNYSVAPGVAVGASYRYSMGPTLEVFSTELSDGTNHSVLASLTFDLN